MKDIMFSFQHAGISKEDILSSAPLLNKEIELLNSAKKLGYNDERASINLPLDKAGHKKILALTKKHKDAPCIIIVGIGGSNLGAKAIFEAVKGKYHNLLSTQKILFADTVDPDSLTSIMAVMKESISQKKKIVLCFITKSGGTTETVANFEVLYSSLKKSLKNNNNVKESVVVITDEHSKLWDLAGIEGFSRLAVPKKVGGRYSVFSAAGLFPLALAGVNTGTLLKGAAAMRERCLSRDLLRNPAALSAISLYHQYKNGKNINDTFLFANDLESVGKWYRQLMGESIGKEFDRKNRKINCGMTPTVSIGSTDLHSMAQLYLGGPFDKFTTFITIKKFNNTIKTPPMGEYNTLVENIQNRDVGGIMNAIVSGVKAAYQKNGRHYFEISMPDKLEESIGQLLQFKMMEVMVLGSLLGVNPFDQPNVESYKVETKKLLAIQS